MRQRDPSLRSGWQHGARPWRVVLQNSKPRCSTRL